MFTPLLIRRGLGWSRHQVSAVDHEDVDLPAPSAVIALEVGTEVIHADATATEESDQIHLINAFISFLL